VAPTSSAVRKELSTPGGFDLLHFAGHGEAEMEDSANAALLLQGRVEAGNFIPDYFNATTAEYHSAFRQEGEPGPVIVLNACQVGRASYRLTDTGGFARAFLKRGASAFIGALWSVGDQPARTFTEEFYRQFKERTRLADAACSALEMLTHNFVPDDVVGESFQRVSQLRFIHEKKRSTGMHSNVRARTCASQWAFSERIVRS